MPIQSVSLCSLEGVADELHVRSCIDVQERRILDTVLVVERYVNHAEHFARALVVRRACEYLRRLEQTLQHGRLVVVVARVDAQLEQTAQLIDVGDELSSRLARTFGVFDDCHYLRHASYR